MLRIKAFPRLNFLTLASSLAIAMSAPATGLASPTYGVCMMSHTVPVGASVLAFDKCGSGPAVIIVHGIGGHKEDWAAVAAKLAPLHTVYAVDMLGFGASSKTGETITIADQVAALVALMDAEKISKADVIGNSVGGWVAATLAADHPDRVNRLVLSDAAGFKAMFDGPPPVEFYPQDAAQMTKLLQTVRFDPATHQPAYIAKALEASKASGDAQSAAAVGKGMFVSPRLEDVADRVTAPTLIIWGADLVAGHIKGSRTVLIPKASHFPQLDNPAAFEAAVIEFLRS